MTSLKNKVAVVTGSTSGIGLGIAKAMAKQGARVMLNGLGDAAQIEETRSALEKETGSRILFHGADMTQPDQITAMMELAKSEWGGVDIVVNNAGIQHVAAIEEFPPEKWEQIIRINLISAFYTIRHALPHMKEKGWGRVINISSVHGLVASPFKSAYIAAKHGLNGLTKTIALEVAQQGVTVNAICPGYVKTPLVENQIKDQAKTRGISEDEVVKNVLLGAQPTKKFAKIEDIAELGLFLCSDAAANMTGSLISIDGGWSAQ